MDTAEELTLKTFDGQWKEAQKNPFVKMAFLLLIESFRKHKIVPTAEHLIELLKLTETFYELSDLDCPV